MSAINDLKTWSMLTTPEKAVIETYDILQAHLKEHEARDAPIQSTSPPRQSEDELVVKYLNEIQSAVPLFSSQKEAIADILRSFACEIRRLP